MASVGSLTVEIAADIAKLRSGVEETQSRLAGLERTTAKTGQNMQRSFEASVAGINAAWIKMGVVAATAMKAWDFAEQAAGFQEQKQMLAGLAGNYKTSADNIINSMSEASDGLIAKTDLMKVALAGMSKGLDPKGLIQLAGAADTLGDSVGKNATEAFQDLTEAITKGTEKQLKAYLGAQDLDRAMSQLPKDASEYEKAQARLNAVLDHAARIQKTMGDESESTADKMDHFKAQVADLKLGLGEGLVSAGLAVVSVFQGISATMFSVIGAYSKLQAALGGTNTKSKAAYLAQAQAAEEQRNTLFASMEKNWKIAFSEIKQPSATSAAKTGFSSADTSSAEAQNKTIPKVNKEYEKEQKLIYDQLVKDAEEQANALRQIKEISAEDNRKIDEMEMERAEAWAEQRIQVYQDMVQRITDLNQQIASAQTGMDKDAISKGLEGTNIATPLMGLMNSMNGQDEFQAQIDRIEEQYAVQLELLQEYQDTRFSMEEGFVSQREQMEKLAASRQLAIDRLTRQQRVSMAQNTFGTLAGVAQAFYAASDNQNKAALNAYKAFAIAETLIATYSSAQKLFDFGSKFGPWTAAAFAAIGIAAGMARVQQIASVQAGSSTVSAGAGSGVSAGEGGASAATDTTAATTTTAAAEPATSQIVNIYIQGNVVDQDKFAREVLPAIRKAMGDGV